MMDAAKAIIVWCNFSIAVEKEMDTKKKRSALFFHAYLFLVPTMQASIPV